MCAGVKCGLFAGGVFGWVVPVPAGDEPQPLPEVHATGVGSGEFLVALGESEQLGSEPSAPSWSW